MSNLLFSLFIIKELSRKYSPYKVLKIYDDEPLNRNDKDSRGPDAGVFSY